MRPYELEGKERCMELIVNGADGAPVWLMSSSLPRRHRFFNMLSLIRRHVLCLFALVAYI